MANNDNIKAAVGEFAANHYELQGLIGLGTGTTFEAFLMSLGNDFKRDPKKYRGCQFITSSDRSEKLALSFGLKVLKITSEAPSSLEIQHYIDGLDQVDEQGRMIKGRGGALTREKILCQYSAKKIFLCDYTKVAEKLTTSMPLEIIPLSYPFIRNKLQKELSVDSELRKSSPSEPYTTDNGNWVLDLFPPKTGGDWSLLSKEISSWAGTVETGFFDPRPYELIIGYPDGEIEIIQH